MKLRSRMTGTVLIGTLTMFGLAACGSDDSDTKDDKQDSSSAPTEDANSDSSEESSGDKPSKDEVVAGYAGFLNETTGGQLPEGTVQELLTCIVDDVYDDISDESAQALAAGNATGVSPEDAQKLATATGNCTSSITGQ